MLTHIFFLQLRVIGSTMGTKAELASLVQLLDATGTRPLVDRVLPMTDARAGQVSGISRRSAFILALFFGGRREP